MSPAGNVICFQGVLNADGFSTDLWLDLPDPDLLLKYDEQDPDEIFKEAERRELTFGPSEFERFYRPPVIENLDAVEGVMVCFFVCALNALTVAVVQFGSSGDEIKSEDNSSAWSDEPNAKSPYDPIANDSEVVSDFDDDDVECASQWRRQKDWTHPVDEGRRQREAIEMDEEIINEMNQIQDFEPVGGQIESEIEDSDKENQADCNEETVTEGDEDDLPEEV